MCGDAKIVVQERPHFMRKLNIYTCCTAKFVTQEHHLRNVTPKCLLTSMLAAKNRRTRVVNPSQRKQKQDPKSLFSKKIF